MVFDACLYAWHAHEADFSQEVFKNMADEERVHAGEFLMLLYHLAPDEEEFYKEGFEDVEGRSNSYLYTLFSEMTS
jgi:rubrerythrin